MVDWDEPDFTAAPEPEQDQPEAEGNVFARLARFAVVNAMAVVAVALFFAAVAFAIAMLRVDFLLDRPASVTLDAQTASAQAAIERLFPGLDETMVARVEIADARQAKRTAMAIAEALQKRNELFVGARVAGVGDYYSRYGVLFRDVADIEARTAKALRLQPLLRAIAAAPDLAGFNAIVAEIGRAVESGQPPGGIEEMLLSVAASVEGEVTGKRRAVNWVALAGLSQATETTVWFVVADPVAGQEREAAAAAANLTRKLDQVIWYFPTPAVQSTFDFLRTLGVPAFLGFLLTVMVFSMGLGRPRMVIMAVLAAVIGLAATALAAAAVLGDLDSVTWSIAGATLTMSFVSTTLTLNAYADARNRGFLRRGAVVEAAGARGPLIAALALALAAFWLAWLFFDLPSALALAVVMTISIASSVVSALLVIPALIVMIDDEEDVPPHVFDDIVAGRLGPGGRNFRQIATLIVVAIASFCAVFVPALQFGDGSIERPDRAALESPSSHGAVHLLSQPGEPARALIAEIAKLPETGAIRWVEQYLPVDADRKIEILKQLAPLLPASTAPRAPADSAALLDTLTSLQSNLQVIARNSAAAPELRNAAHRLRRAVSVFTDAQAPSAARVLALEDSMFAGLVRLSQTVSLLARLQAPGIAELDADLRRRFVAEDGRWRIEVLQKPEASSRAFAAAMRKLQPSAAGIPIVSLARSEIIYHEATRAFGAAFLAAVIILLAYIRRPLRWVIIVLPAALLVCLSAAVIAGMGGQLGLPVLFAVATAVGLMLASGSILALREEELPAHVPDNAVRTAILPPLAGAAAVVPLAISANEAVAIYGIQAAIFNLFAAALAVLVLPTLVDWADNRISWSVPRWPARREEKEEDLEDFDDLAFDEFERAFQDDEPKRQRVPKHDEATTKPEEPPLADTPAQETSGNADEAKPASAEEGETPPAKDDVKPSG